MHWVFEVEGCGVVEILNFSVDSSEWNFNFSPCVRRTRSTATSTEQTSITDQYSYQKNDDWIMISA